MGKEKTLQPRQVAVAIPYCLDDAGQTIVCLVSSRKHDGLLVLPKGGIEKGESGWQSAVREMWEEAGLRPSASDLEPSSCVTPISTVLDHKPHKKSLAQTPDETGFVARAEYRAFAVPVRRGDPACEADQWPEQDERQRSWTTYGEACKAIEWRRDIHQLLLCAESHLQQRL